MALPATLALDPQPWRPSIFGKAINFVPGDPTIAVEVQRATDATGTGATTIATGLFFPKPGAPFVDMRANDGSSWFYRARHNGIDVDAGVYTPWVGGVVKAIPKDILAAAVNFGGSSVYPIVRSFALSDGLYALQATETDGSTKVSTAHNPQGSVLPIPFKGNLFTGFWGGIGSGQMYVAFLWTTQTLYKPDGSTLTLPGPPAALSLAGGDLGQIAGGVRGATTLWARRGLVKDGHVYALSGEQSFAVSANNRLTVAAPAAVPGYDGWCVLVGSASNSEYLQESGGTPYPIAFGTSYTEPTGHFSTAAAQYTGDWLGTIVYVDLNASTTYYFYPYYDIALGFLRMAPVGDAVGDSAPSMADANKAWSDGRIALSSTGMSVVVGGGGTNGNSPTGGSRLT